MLEVMVGSWQILEVAYLNTQNLRDVRNEEVFSNNILVSCWNEESKGQAIAHEASMALHPNFSQGSQVFMSIGAGVIHKFIRCT
jgi:hypothetical protein